MFTFATPVTTEFSNRCAASYLDLRLLAERSYARFGPTTPTRAGRVAAASVDYIDARRSTPKLSGPAALVGSSQEAAQNRRDLL
jgi:hypothetical protein